MVCPDRSLIMKMGAIFTQGICTVLSVAVLIKKMPFCRSQVQSHSCTGGQGSSGHAETDVLGEQYGLMVVMLPEHPSVLHQNHQGLPKHHLLGGTS